MWTLQEEVLSMRILQFTESQVDFSCLMGSVSEGTDPDTGFNGGWIQHSAQPLMRMVTRLELVSNLSVDFYSLPYDWLSLQKKKLQSYLRILKAQCVCMVAFCAYIPAAA